MKLTNTTDLPTPFLRRLVVWVCRQLDLPLSAVRQATFKNSRYRYAGRASSRGHVRVRIGKQTDHAWPFAGRRNSLAPEFVLADRLEALVKVTAHELAHLERWHRLGTHIRNNEADVDRLDLPVLRAFRLCYGTRVHRPGFVTTPAVS